MVIRFTVEGPPKPKGSFRPYTFRRRDGRIGARVDNDNIHTSAWQECVAWAAHAATPKPFAVMRGPIALSVEFYLPRPQRLRKGTSDHVTKPDVDKLLRALCDGLKDVLYADDSQVVEVRATKRYAVNLAPCAQVVVTER